MTTQNDSILYVTDLHGDMKKYDAILKIAKKKKIKCIINGGDMLPKGLGSLHVAQRDFLEGYLKDYLEELAEEGVHYYGMLGNDDLKINDKYFENLVKFNPFLYNIAQKKKFLFPYLDYEIIGCNFVCDYPFRLKDRCVLDDEDSTIDCPQYGEGLLSIPEGYDIIEDWNVEANKRLRLKQILGQLKKPENQRKAIYVIHMPPSGLRLDVCADGRRVGSKSVLDFIVKKKPYFVLCGHIHESPEMTGTWETEIDHGDGTFTSVIQPGQGGCDKLNYVIINLKDQSADWKVKSV